jgi:hypothetical protein
MLVLIGSWASPDVAHVQRRAELQSVADAAALAAVQIVSDDDPGTSWANTRTEAITVAGRNLVAGAPLELDANWGNAETGDIVIGSWDRLERVFTPSSVDAHVVPVHDAVLVRARRTASPSGGLALSSRQLRVPAAGHRVAIAQWAGDPVRAFCSFIHQVGPLDIRGRVVLHVPHDGIR